MDAPKQPLRIHCNQSIFVAGGEIEGEVELYFPVVQTDEIEEVHIKLRGFAKTMIHRDRTTVTQRLALACENRSLWARGRTYPAPGAHTLRIPFRFVLPARLPPAFAYSGIGKSAGVQYFLEAVGVRDGLLHANRRTVRPLAVLPPDPAGLPLRAALQQGWAGPWTTVTRQEKVRRGLWGDYAHVRLELTYPALPAFPLFTRIPFTLHVRTVSKPMKEDDAPRDKPVFPAPPARARDVAFSLKRGVALCARMWRAAGGDTVGCVGGMGNNVSAPCEVEVADRVWEPLGEGGAGKGTWAQETTFRSALLLKCPPTFSSQTISVTYRLHVQVDFGGFFNSLSADIPIDIVSAMVPAQNKVDYAAQPPPEAGAPPLPPPPKFEEEEEEGLQAAQLDLPPTYWNASGAEYAEHKD